KGVMVEQGCVVNMLLDLQKVYTLDSDDKVTEFTSYVFDVSVSEIFSTILQGASLHLLSDEVKQDSEALRHYLLRYKITYTYLPPIVLSQLPRENYSSLRSIVYAGEPLDKKSREYWSDRLNLFNCYGPTEATVYTTVANFMSGDIDSIGYPIQNTKLYVLDGYHNPVPTGVIGELYIGGAGLARGYLNCAVLTEERFIVNSFASEEDKAKGYTRLYKTGDLVRWLADGNLEYIGRNDFQVKIRGYRIELGEIEKVLCQIEGIVQCAVIAREHKLSENETSDYLVGYYMLSDQDNSVDINSEDLIAALSKQLPAYMVPQVYVELESLPLTVNGKLDREALPDPVFGVASERYSAPRNELEAKLCRLWEELLGVERVGITDNFFRLGGNSILAIRLVNRMNEVLSYKAFNIVSLFIYKNIQELLSNVTIKSRAHSLIKELSIANSTKQKMFFIHPGNGGCEVYAKLAKRLQTDYNCFGIDNYNILNHHQIDNLNLLAQKYIDVLPNLEISDKIILCGWSLGGQIALEMGYILEQQGFRRIEIFLFDTIIKDNVLIKYYKQQDVIDLCKKTKEYMLSIGYKENYIKKVLQAFPAERSLLVQGISGVLRFSEVVLFKALEKDRSIVHGREHRYTQTLEDNNIGQFVRNLKVIPVACSHGNILEYLMDKNWVKTQKKTF
ncbi:MAG: AMP-binding protein, partial [Pseudomonadota bacterium]